ncbi:MAG: cytochrome c [bacterium]|nr:cytochrome c [Gammaproteobacteria bacterium]HIL98322.1 cytochrome c [Pseudomonadales bacterium]
MNKIVAMILLGVLSLSSYAQDVDAGKKLFGTFCQSCHGPDGDGNGPANPEQSLKPRSFALAAFKFDTDADWQKGTDADLADVIRKGPAVYGGSPLMPGWSQFSDAEIKSLIVYIRSLES